MANGNQRTDQGRASAMHELVVDGLPPCTIALIADETWHVVAQLATDDQAALTAAVTHPDTLCQRAQHALGLAGIGSRIAPDHTAIGVYAAQLPTPARPMPLVLEGRALLCWVSRAPSESIRALIAAAIEVMRAARDA
jgi:hypothetical protein